MRFSNILLFLFHFFFYFFISFTIASTQIPIATAIVLSIVLLKHKGEQEVKQYVDVVVGMIIQAGANKACQEWEHIFQALELKELENWLLQG